MTDPTDYWPSLEARIALYLERGAMVTPEPGGSVTLFHPLIGELWVSARRWQRAAALQRGAS